MSKFTGPLGGLFEEHDAIVFFDTETTGLDYKTNRIIELAAIRVEKKGSGELSEAAVTDVFDSFVKLPVGQIVPPNITELTGITDNNLSERGMREDHAMTAFSRVSQQRGKPTLLIAHNAQFDLLFLKEALNRCMPQKFNPLEGFNFLDTLTVFKDRRSYPNKLSDAITEYHLENEASNSHRAIDDVMALFEVAKAMDRERSDLHTYVNIFGYHPKYGVYGEKLPNIKYSPQQSCKWMNKPSYTLPAVAARTEKEAER